jgi:maltoporin
MTTTHHRVTSQRIAIATLGLAAGLLASTSAQAVDFGGYFRAGPGATKKDAARACYGLSGPGLKYRLGNECDLYGEFLLSQGFQADGVDYKVNMMTNIFNPGTDTGDAKVGINQMYVEGKGYDIAPQASFWIGKRFYGRADVHIVDTKYTVMDGVGAGADNIVNLGSGKLNLAYFRTDGDATHPGSRLNADAHDIDVNPGGKLRVVGTFTNGDFSGGKSGLGLSFQHNQELPSLGGSNTAWLQFATGSAGLDSNFGNLAAVSGTKSFRIVESLTWQLGPFGGQAQALWQTDKDGATGLKTDSSTVGGRASYAVTKNFKLVSELGYSQKKPENGATQKLTKFTFAPTLATGPGFWSRPELRLYVTTAKWNDAANAAAGSGGLTGIGDGKTSGTSYGAQVEIWF